MKPRRIRTTLLAVAMAGTVPGVAHAIRIDYTIDAGVERDDNVTLASEDPIEQTIARAGIGFAIEQDSSTVQASVAGRVDHRRYDDVYGSMTDRLLEGRLAWMAIPERLTLVVEDSYGVQTINRTAPGTPDNRQQVNVLSLGPDLEFGRGLAWRGLAGLRYINSDAEVTDQFNSDRLLASVSMLRGLDATRAVSLNARGQRVDFDDDTVARDHRRYEAFAGYRHQLRRLQIEVDLGYAFLDYDDGESRSNPLLRAGLEWMPSERSRFSLDLANQFSDAASSALERIGETTGVPATIVTGSSTITPYAYELRSASAGYGFTGERFEASVDGFVQRLDFVDQAGQNEKSRGMGSALRYRLRQDLVLSATADVGRVEFDGPEARVHTDRLYSLSLDKSWARHWRTTLTVTRYEREARGATDEFDQNVVYLNLIYSNR